MENNHVDMSGFSPETFSTEGFRDVSALYKYLDLNRTLEDFVFSHGDYCLPNVFVSGVKTTVFFLIWETVELPTDGRTLPCASVLCIITARKITFTTRKNFKIIRCYYSRNLPLSRMRKKSALEPDEEKIRYLFYWMSFSKIF